MSSSTALLHPTPDDLTTLDCWSAIELVLSPACTDAQLTALATHADEAVRQQVGRRARLPLALVDALATDASPFVRRAVASSQWLPYARVRELREDPSPSVRAGLALNVHTPLGTVDRLASDADEKVAFAVASRPRLTDRSVRALAASASPFIRSLIAIHPDLPPDARRQLVVDPEVLVRMALAWRPDRLTPAEFLFLVGDPELGEDADCAAHFVEVASEHVAWLATGVTRGLLLRVIRSADVRIRLTAVRLAAYWRP